MTQLPSVYLPHVTLPLPVQSTQWQPVSNGLLQIISLFYDPPINNITEQNIYNKQQYEQLQLLSKHPEFNNYLVYILSTPSNILYSHTASSPTTNSTIGAGSGSSSSSSSSINNNQNHRHSMNEIDTVRARAGLKLKNNILESFHTMHHTVQEYRYIR